MKKQGRGVDKRQTVFVVNTGVSGANVVNRCLTGYNFRFAGTMEEADLIILSDGLAGVNKVLPKYHSKTVILLGGVSRITVEEAIKAIRDDHFRDVRTNGGFENNEIVSYVTYWLNELAKG